MDKLVNKNYEFVNDMKQYLAENSENLSNQINLKI